MSSRSSTAARLQAAFARPGGDALRAPHRRDAQRGVPVPVRPTGGRAARRVPARCAAGDVTATLSGGRRRAASLLHDLGGHDLGAAARALAAGRRREDRPSSSSPTRSRAGACRSPATPSTTPPSSPRADRRVPRRAGHRPGVRLGPPRPATPAGAWCGRRRRGAEAAARPLPCRPLVPERTGLARPRSRSPLRRLSAGSSPPCTGRGRRAIPRHRHAGRRGSRRTSAAGSTRSGSSRPEDDRSGRRPGAVVGRGPQGQHIELGISEMNLFLLLGQLGLAWDLSDEPLLPVGTVYDPFVCRGLDAFIYSAYSGLAFRHCRHPVGRHAAPEGGATSRPSRRRSGSSSPA